jgi:CRP-like cAMP-binding protein
MASITRNAFEKVAMEDKDMGMRVYRNIAGEIATRLRRANKDILKLTTALSIALEG